jgi:Flp pilus assembly protein TadG
MTSSSCRRPGRGERGSVAVEAALLMMTLVIMIAGPLFLGRVFWHYTALQKAAQDGARFLSTATPTEMMTLGSRDEAGVAALARDIVRAETAELHPAENKRIIDVQCDLATCGDSIPANVRVRVTMRLKDPAFYAFTNLLAGDQGLKITADVSMRYVGR